MNKFDIDLTQRAEDEELSLLNEFDFCFPEGAVFIKEDEYNGKSFWGIYDLEGTRLAVTEDRECAFAIARQNDFIPNSAH